MRELVSSLVASANRFLAPYERVVAFQVLPRALDLEHGELTHKHTFKRDVVGETWKPLIDKMYERKHLTLQIGSGSLRIPNWVLREMGVLQHEVSLEGDRLRAAHRTVAVGDVPYAPGALRIGDLAYSAEKADGAVDLGALLSPAFWLGNEALRAFLGEEAFVAFVSRRRKSGAGPRVDPRWWPPPAPERLKGLLAAIAPGELTYRSIHAAAELLRAERPEASRGMAHLHLGLSAALPEHAALCRALLRRAADAPDEDVRRRAFRVLIPHEEPADTLGTLRLFLDRFGPAALRDEELADLGEHALTEAQLGALLAHLSADEASALPADASDRRLLVATMRLVAATAIARPVFFAPARIPLARLTLHEDSEIAARAAEELDRLRRGFSNWVGPNLRLAIDPQTGAEYGWKDVLVFDENVPPAAAHHLLLALSDTTIVRASIFLLGRGVLLSLADIPLGGAAVSLLGRQHGKSVYRLSIHTRAREAFDVAVNVADDMTFAELREEVSWLLAAGAAPPLVEQFGGYFAEWGIFTEEFIPGLTVEKQVARLVRKGEPGRVRSLWPFLVWTALEGHVRLWDRTGRRLALREPSPAAFIVPSHDYHAGARLVSISDRTPCTGLDELLDRFQESFISRIETSRPDLRGLVDDALLFSAVVEGLGQDRGVALLAAAAPESRRAVAVETFLEGVRERGLAPQRVYFATRRYRRWLEVNPEATAEARGKMLAELWSTYRLSALEHDWPDTRLRFYRETVFREARPELGTALDRLMSRTRALPPGGLDLAEQVAAMRGAVAPTTDEDYFLARMTYRYLGPGDEVALISMPLRRPLRHRGGGGPRGRAGRPLHRPRPRLAPRGGTPAAHVPRREPARDLHDRSRVPALPRREGDAHRRPVLQAGRPGPDPAREAGHRAQAPRQGGGGRPRGRALPAPARARRGARRDRLLPARVPAALRVPHRSHLRRPRPRPRAGRLPGLAPWPSRPGSSSTRPCARASSSRRRTSAPRRSSRSRARSTPSASSTWRSPPPPPRRSRSGTRRRS